jgi:hypothetical protein
MLLSGIKNSRENIQICIFFKIFIFFHFFADKSRLDLYIRFIVIKGEVRRAEAIGLYCKTFDGRN